MFQRTITEGDFQSSDRGASFVCTQDADTKGAAGVIDKWAQTFSKGVVVFGLSPAFFKSFAENEVIEAAPLKDLINALKFETMGQLVGAGTFGHFRDWPKRQGVAFWTWQGAYFGCGKLIIDTVFAAKRAKMPSLFF